MGKTSDPNELWPESVPLYDNSGMKTVGSPMDPEPAVRSCPVRHIVDCLWAH